MLRRNKRLSQQDNIQKITKEGDKVDSRFLVARYRPNEVKNNRYGVVISSKVEKKAVHRNKLRRRIYETIRHLEKEGVVPKQKTFDIVLFVRKPLLTQDYLGVTKAVTNILTTLYGKEK